MAGTWKELKDKIVKETERIWLTAPEDLKALFMGALKNKAGSYDQWWTVIDFANGMIRDFSMYTMYPILKAVMDPIFTLDQAKLLVKYVHPPVTDYLRYSNFITLDKFDREFISVLDTIKTKEEFIELYTVYLKYVNKLAAWSYHYMTWEVSALYPYRVRSDEFIKELAEITGNK